MTEQTTEQTTERAPERPAGEPTPTPVPEPEPTLMPTPEPTPERPAGPVAEANAGPAAETPTETPTEQSAERSAETPAGPVAPRRTRRVLWAVARWTAAVVVCGGVGTGTALGITGLDRDEVPGLATESDGRWEYPRLALPALPADKPRPFTAANDGEIHHADPRALLLPAPAGATPDPKLDGGFVSTEAYLSLYGEEFRGDLRKSLSDSTLRHVVARGWTMPDGTRTSIHLLRFSSVAYAESYGDTALEVDGTSGPKALPLGVETPVPETLADDVEVPETRAYVYREKKPYGAEQTRWAYVQAGDTLALITQTRKGESLAVPFQQTATLQNQLLG
ncbi:hypothetical protein [Streptomyces sp. NPDC088557]|uniref:hypothetical protein n=1 Tax=Streptomyces sp. NPDC088557 TaxID=3365867 RepID=UPI00382FDCC9